MNNTNYAYAVTAVRAQEAALPDKAFIQQLINADSYSSVRRILSDKGVTASGNDFPVDIFHGYMTDVWNFLTDISPDISKLYFLIVKNDFHNLKASVKSVVSESDAENIFIAPCIIDAKQVYEAVKSKKFDMLPSWIAETAENAYDLLTSTMDGQLFDMFIDSASLKAMIDFAENSSNKLCIEFAHTFAALADIKIALRLSRGSISEALLGYAFCECDGIDITMLKKAVKKGTDEVCAYISETLYGQFFSEDILKTPALLECKCDNILSEITDRAKHISFGPEPLAAYYYTQEIIWKNLRIIVSAKRAELPSAAINERMRELYV